MTKIEKDDIIKWAISGIFSGLFAWMFTILTESFNPLIILYTILSTLGVLILFHGIEKVLNDVYEKGYFWFEIKKYNKKVNQVAETVKDELIKKEIYIVDSIELTRYFDPKIRFYKPSRASVSVLNVGAIKDSTLDVFNKMTNTGVLIHIESYRLLLLREKMFCTGCGGQIIFHDKIDHVDIKCQKCSAEYRIDHDGLWHLNNKKDSSGYEIYIRTKHLDRLRV